ncbi:alpha-glucosidase [Lactobacillus sp. ESL0679]|uniref:alpha-glucosidase n=1 Tax=Lactobacillus sp. ESL0679 TaxID=2983209 RepID=UPI0023F78241|nr:alpha-glucosidase [Lactobacillus sp. ESL0679]MDF7682360.1 alpha-glucosidase [Lactobacillus sp. ESL0679]
MKHWYEHAIIYQIYPKSFQDSNGDGIGDLNGIKKRIPYLQKLGINAVWLNPVFVSPQVDNGYDVTDYLAIDPQMGTMAEMTDLIAAFHQAGIHVIMDFVLNHTSDQNYWFQQAIKHPDSSYRDYYIFAGKNNERPNNWGSFFGGSVWEPDPAQTGESYFHLFDKHMPDLNWRNPQVRKEMLKIAEYWLDKGIDGLRLDAFIHIAKADLNQDFPLDSSEDDTVVAEPFFANLPQVQEWLHPFCQQIKHDYPETLLLGEAASANVNLAVDYTAKNRQLMDNVITFRYFTDDESQLDPNLPAQYQPKPLDWLNFKQTQAVWQQTLVDIAQPILYWNNHDMPRVATRIAKTPTQVCSLAMLMYLERGIPIIYYGEELGLKNYEFTTSSAFADDSVNEFIKQAEQAGKSEEEALALVSQTHKMPARCPMPWTDEKFGGFSTVKPWLTGKKLDHASVSGEITDPNSTFNFYRWLIALKKTPLFQDGNFNLYSTGQDSYVYQRKLKNEQAIVAVSLSSEKIKITLPEGNYEEKLVAGQYHLTGSELLLMPYSGVVLSNNGGKNAISSFKA